VIHTVLARPRARLNAWWMARHPPSETHLLTQRNVYILPTRAGWMFAFTLLLLLLATINYQLSLGYVLTFLLAGSGAASMHQTHATLRGLTLHLRPVAPTFVGQAALIDVVLADGPKPRARHGIGLRFQGADTDTLTWIDVLPGEQTSAQLGHVPTQRGQATVPALQVETRFPLGLFRAWTVWRPSATVLAWPAPEHPAAALPLAQSRASGRLAARRGEAAEADGVRAYRRGDALKTVLWKKSAHALAGGGDLVSRDALASLPAERVLDWADAAPLAPEQRLSRLCAWVLSAHADGAPWQLMLPGQRLGPDVGEAHRLACLRALALWGAA
jgi:uncharacterized protein (DUF58 family)